MPQLCHTNIKLHSCFQRSQLKSQQTPWRLFQDLYRWSKGLKNPFNCINWLLCWVQLRACCLEIARNFYRKTSRTYGGITDVEPENLESLWVFVTFQLFLSKGYSWESQKRLPLWEECSTFAVLKTSVLLISFLSKSILVWTSKK